MFIGDMVDFVNKVHAALAPAVRKDKTFTVAMASNYVKSGLTPPAIGHRYERDHLALILFAATAKLSFSAGEVLILANKLFDPDDMQSSHDAFAHAVNRSFEKPALTSLADAVAASLVARIATFESMK